MSLLRRAFERRDLFTSIQTHELGAPMGSSAIPPNSYDGYGVSATGSVISERSAFGLTTFYACVSLLADVVASLPWDAYRKRDGTRKEVDPQPSLLARPSREMNTFEYKHAIVSSLATAGNFIAYINEFDDLGWPIDTTPLAPAAVRVDRDPTTGRKRWWAAGDELQPERVLHIPFLLMSGQDWGLSPIAAARQSLGLGLAAQEYGARWFRDGADPRSVLETDADLDDAAISRTQRTWVQSHGGRRLPAVVTGGLKYKGISITPEESQFLQTRQYQDQEICTLMGVPPHMVGIVDRSTSWGTGIEQQSIGFVTYKLGPSYLSRIEQALSNILPRGQFVKFNVDGLLRGDQKARYDAYKIAIETGWRNPDEVRALEELPPIPGGKGAEYRQPLNFGPLGGEEKPPEPVVAEQPVAAVVPIAEGEAARAQRSGSR